MNENRRPRKKLDLVGNPVVPPDTSPSVSLSDTTPSENVAEPLPHKDISQLQLSHVRHMAELKKVKSRSKGKENKARSIRMKMIHQQRKLQINATESEGFNINIGSDDQGPPGFVSLTPLPVAGFIPLHSLNLQPSVNQTTVTSQPSPIIAKNPLSGTNKYKELKSVREHVAAVLPEYQIVNNPLKKWSIEEAAKWKNICGQ
uniref:Uncharacterized protein n=1 Tax=Panagrolaimus superbus TaxID=310955 RepID=A0A914Y1F8_9BILA